ncbi:type VII secretion-associated protein [Staphylococcus chromogenes]|nr:type VII secretion-associated protein [Staphylococcus chromogenes]
MEPIKITVLEAATVFDGPEHIYRYDLPGSGITAGWAISAVVDQIKTIAGDRWPNIDVEVSGDERAVEMLTRTLLNKGIGAYPSEALDNPMADAPDIVRPTRGKDHSRTWEFSWFHVAIAAVICSVIAVSWWGLDSSAPTETHAVPPPISSAPPSSAMATVPAAPSPARDDATVVEHGPIRMKVPRDFTLAPRQDGKLQATGRDPNFRILVAADPIYDVEPAAIRHEVELMVSRDNALSPLAGEKLRGDTPTVDYHENPGDGSNVRWVSWVEHGHQFSVGCHSRFEITVPHRAACRMAVESVQLKN